MTASIASTVETDEQGVLAGAGPAAAHIDRGTAGLPKMMAVTRGERCIIGVPDADAGDIGEEIIHRGKMMHCRARVNRAFLRSDSNMTLTIFLTAAVRSVLTRVPGAQTIPG